MTGDYSGRMAMDDFDDMPDTTDWCVGGCESWKESEEGLIRHNELHKRWIELS